MKKFDEIIYSVDLEGCLALVKVIKRERVGRASGWSEHTLYRNVIFKRHSDHTGMTILDML